MFYAILNVLKVKNLIQKLALMSKIAMGFCTQSKLKRSRDKKWKEFEFFHAKKPKFCKSHKNRIFVKQHLLKSLKKNIQIRDKKN
jgi:hypothetical protein